VGKILLGWVLPIALMIYVLVDCAQDDEVERTQIPKGLWMVLVIVLPYVGPIAWLVVSKIARPRGGGRTGGGDGTGAPWPGRPQRRPGPSAPDDDSDFLRQLAEEQARKRREQGRTEKPKEDPA